MLAVDLPLAAMAEGGSELALEGLGGGGLVVACLACAVCGVLGYLVARKRGHRNLQQTTPSLSAQLTSQALDHLPAHVAIIDQSGQIVASNEAWRRFGQQAGAPPSVIDQGVNYLKVCQRAADSSVGSPEDRADAQLVLQGLEKLLAGEIDELFHHYPCHAPSRQQWFQLRAAAMLVTPDRSSKPQRFVVICHEQVTEAQVAHHALTDRTSRGSEHSRLLSLEEMASGLAHELHQPLMAISTYAGGVLRLLDRPEGSLASDLRAPLEKLSQQTARAQEIIKRMRSLITKQNFTPAPTDIASIVRESIRLLEIDPRFRSIRVNVEGVNQAIAQADGVQLQQVIVNLIRNAIEATQAAGRQAPVVVHISQACGHTVVRVTDQGQGLSEEQRSRLFQPFFTTKPSGTGLGLLICEKIAQLHGGSITLESTSPVGSTFALAIPTCSDASQPESESASPRHTRAA